MMIKIFADTSDINEIKELNQNPLVTGFTTNPSLMRKAGIIKYEKFAKEVLEIVKSKPVSFEVFADEFSEMERQAKIISNWGSNVYIKIPITNTRGESSVSLINELSDMGIKVNVTAVTIWEQYYPIEAKAPMIVSIFAGRIADTGRDPSKYFGSHWPAGVEFLWASPREVLNIYQAEEAGAQIITCTPEIIKKYELLKDKDLKQVSLDTVKQFYEDAKEAGYEL